MSEDKFLYKELSYKIVGLAMQVHRELGPGFLEKVYENALMVLFEESGIQAKAQFPINVFFHDQKVGEFVADILVAEAIILELKAQETLLAIHRAQTINYLKASGLQVAYLINFGKQSLQYERFVR